MTKIYFREHTHRLLGRLGLAATLLAGTALGAQAQTLNYLVGGATNITTTYTDLASTGTAIATADTDDANSTAQEIGFTFKYNGTNYTQFFLNTNGFIKLGATAPSDTKLFLSEINEQQLDVFQSPDDPNIIAALNVDLMAGSAGGTEYRVATTGTAPNRICTIQWKNVADKAATNPTQFANLSMQVRLYETTNVVDIVYGSATAGTTSALRFTQAGLKGSSFASGQLVQPVKQSTAAWSMATFADFSAVQTSGSLNTINIRSVAPPDAGRTFRFTPVPDIANDAAVSAVYTLGKLATPLSLPHAVRAVITNTGSATITNVPVTLNVTGANTFTDTKTVASLAIGASATVTFTAYPATLTTGLNTVTVTVPDDGKNTNNSASYGQLVTNSRISYVDTLATTTGGIGLGNAYLLSKYTLSNVAALNSVRLTFAASTNNTAPYQVLVYDASGTGGLPGQLLYTSATLNRTAAGGDVSVALPNVAVPTTFYVGLRETSATNVAIAYQTENPIRSATYYISTNGGTTWTDWTNITPRARILLEVNVITPNCTAPTGVAVSNTSTTGATVSFTPVASGVTSYQVVYGPTGFNPASGGTTVTATTSPVTLTGLTAATIYQVYVRSNCSAGGTSSFTSPVTFATTCDPSAVTAAAPYSLNFDTVLPGQALPCGVTVLDANNDKATWSINRAAPYSGTNAMRYTSAFTNSQAADDWFFTPALTTAAATRYQLAFRYRGEGIANQPSSYTERLEVKAGPSATAAGQTTTLYTNPAITNTGYALANGASAPAVAIWQPGAGTQFIGFHAISAATQGNLYIDDVSISTVLATTSEALLRAITVFPNPSATGLFDLDIHGAKAKSSLEVEVMNTLGQRVYTGSARDNYTNRLDLSALAPGIYHLLVRTGDDFVTRQIAIAK